MRTLLGIASFICPEKWEKRFICPSCLEAFSLRNHVQGGARPDSGMRHPPSSKHKEKSCHISMKMKGGRSWRHSPGPRGRRRGRARRPSRKWTAGSIGRPRPSAGNFAETPRRRWQRARHRAEPLRAAGNRLPPQPRLRKPGLPQKAMRPLREMQRRLPGLPRGGMPEAQAGPLCLQLVRRLLQVPPEEEDVVLLGRP